MFSFGCENNELKMCIESTPPPPIKTKVNHTYISLHNFIDYPNYKHEGELHSKVLIRTQNMLYTDKRK